MSNPSIVFDLDDTICFPNHNEKDTYKKYGLAKPNEEIIEVMQDLYYNQGYKIIINSARRYLTHNGNIEAILKDVEDITLEWLYKYNVPYDELVFGKPYASTYYVDDKAITPTDLIKLHNEGIL